MLERTIENAALNAWPAFEQHVLAGWVLRFADRYTKRANSVTPLDPSTLPLGEHIARCERAYQKRDQLCIFRLPSFAAPAGLDLALAGRGYSVVDPTQVLGRDLTSVEQPGSTCGELRGESLESWMSLYCRFHNLAREQQHTHEQILTRISADRLLAALYRDADVVSCGAGVLDQGCFGLFDLVTAPGHRRQGHGAALVAAMLQWAQRRGATYAYLQVVERNAPARRLYERLGFRNLYRYWYRVPPA